MASRKLEHLHPLLEPLAKEFIAKCAEKGINVIITSTWRSDAEQDALYAQGRTKPGKKVTNAKGGQSDHNFTLNGKPAAKAFDFAIKNRWGGINWDVAHPHWKQAGLIGKGLGLEWGGDWKKPDMPHLALPKSLTP